MWSWKFFLVFGALRINGDCLAILDDILERRPENAPHWMTTRSGTWILETLALLCVGGQIVTVICQFIWFAWYNVVITDVTAYAAALIFYSVFLYPLMGFMWLIWMISYLLLGTALVVAWA
jgi:hypothetical protein